MSKSFFCKILFFSFIFVFSFIAIFAQTKDGDGKDIFSLLDSAFFEKSSDNVSAILASCRSSSHYSEYEDYVLSKTRTLLLSNQLELVQLMTLAVIDNNLDNTDAINLYMTVEKSVEKRKAKQKIVEEQRQAEAQYVAAASEKEKESIRKDYNVVESDNLEQGVFVSQYTSKYYSDFTWSAAFNLADLIMHTDNSDLNIKYGLGISGDFYYHGPKVSLGIDLFSDVSVLDFAGNSSKISEFYAVPGISFFNLNEELYIRLGVVSFNTSDGQFYSPTVGFSYRNIQLASAKLSLFADYYISNFAYSDILFAGGVGANIAIPLADINNIQLGFFVNARESLLIKTSKLDSRTRISLGFGVKSNE